MNILVTGGAGYIGSHTCKALAAQGHRVVVYDNLSTGHRKLVRWGDFFHGDILDMQSLRTCLQRFHIDGVVHFAAKAYVGESVKQPGWYFRNNVVGTLNLLEAMQLEGIKNIIVSGTCAVYGQPAHIPIAENCPLTPINPYGASKLFMERMLVDFEHAHDFRWISLRYFNAAGADAEGECGECHEPETHLIPLALMAAHGSAPALRIFGDDYPTPDGTCIRDYVHVTDLAHAHALAFDYLTTHNTSVTLNLGTGQGISVRQLLHIVEEITGKAVPHTFVARRQGDPARLEADASRAYALLGWQAHHSTPEIITSSAWQWLLHNNILSS